MATSGEKSKCWWLVGVVSFAGAIAPTILCSANQALAQVIPDETLGENSSKIAPNVNIKGSQGDRIDGGAIRGANLFHSFQQFNVGESQRVYFANPTGIENILTRVTGSQISKILGTLGVDGGANLFFLNPNGILFGNNARLDVAGSFVATTANSFAFDNGLEFSATHPQAPPLLKVNLTPGLQKGHVEPSRTITNTGNLAAGQDLKLFAGNLDLHGQLQAKRDLFLQGNTVKVRDSITNPFIAAAGGKLFVQGNESVDIFALNHLNSGLFSGGDMVFQSANTVSGDAHFWSGGSFRIEKLDGSLGNLFSPYDLVIRASGDVSFDSYTGASLHILAGGSVNIPASVTITSTDTPVNSIQEKVTLSDGTTVVDINGSVQPTVDIRAGTTTFATPGITGSTVGFLSVLNINSTGTSADINIGNISNKEGVVFLTNQYKPNTALGGGTIQVRTIDTSSRDTTISTRGNGGAVTIAARKDIKLDNLSSFGGFFSFNNGGAIALTAGGNIFTGKLNSSSFSVNNNAGNGGAIALSANGNITTGNLISDSFSVNGNAGNGGAIALSANGNITTGNLISDSFSGYDNAGNGGAINLQADGNITTANLKSSSYSILGNAGNGGAINLQADGNITTGTLASLSNASNGKNAGNGGSITLRAGGDISAWKLESFSDATIAGFFAGNEGNARNGGAIALTAGGNITTGDLKSFSAAGDFPTLDDFPQDRKFASFSSKAGNGGDAGNGGAIVITAGGYISTGNLESFSEAGDTGSESFWKIDEGGKLESSVRFSKGRGNGGDAGNGGAIILTASSNISTGNLKSFSNSGSADYFRGGIQGEGGNGGAIVLNAGGNISTGDLESFSGDPQLPLLSQKPGIYNLSRSGDADEGGAITLTAGGNITTGNLTSFSKGYFRAGEGYSGNGGSINLKANGNITTGSLTSSSNAGNGGSITFTAGGKIATKIVDSNSSDERNTGNGGSITLTAGTSITTGSLSSFSKSKDASNASNGGAIKLTALSNISTGKISTGNERAFPSGANVGGNIHLISTDGSITTGNLYSAAESQRGNITLDANGDITIRPFSEFSGSFLGNPEVNVSGSGTGGNIILTSKTGNFSLQNGMISSNADRKGNGGNIRIEAQSVSFTNTDLSSTAAGIGKGGSIAIKVPDAVSLTRSRLFTTLELGGIGTGGNIKIDAGSISLADLSFIDTATFGEGNAGNVLVSANSIFLNKSSIFSFTAGRGQSGDVTMQARDNISLSNRSNISTAVNRTAVGNGGQIKLKAYSVSLTGGSQLQALTRGSGDSGNIELNVKDALNISGIGSDGFLSGVFTSSEANSQGKGGNIQVIAGSLVVSEGAVVNAQTASPFAGGNVNVNAKKVELREGGQFLTNTFSRGEAGNITVEATESTIISGVDPNFANRVVPPPVLRDVFAVIPPRTIPDVEPNNFIEQAQNIDAFFSLDSPDNFNPNVEFSTRIPYVSILGTGKGDERPNEFPYTSDYYSFTVETAGTRGFFDLDDRNLDFQPNLHLFDSEGKRLGWNDYAPNFLGAGGSTGNTDPYLKFVFSESGTYFIEVNDFGEPGIRLNDTYTLQISLETPNVAGSAINSGAASGLFAQSQGTGKAGVITINTPQLIIQNGASVSASTSSKGQGGSIAVTASTLEVINGGQLRTNTVSGANAGDIILKVRDNITLAGKESGLFANTELGSSGKGGNIFIDPRSMTIRNDAKIAVDSQGTGIGGNIDLTAGTLTLDRGSISAQTRSNTGGNIALNLQDLLLLRNGSQISTTAGNREFGGDGGNIIINTPFIVAVPNENSDIKADAFAGEGGKVNININGIFGIKPQKRSTEKSDITASSELGVSGEVIINTPNTDPSRGLVQLPSNLVDASQQIAQGCTPRGEQTASRFIATGRGGLPLSPNEPLRQRAAIAGWVDLPQEVTARETDKFFLEVTGKKAETSVTKSTNQIVEAQGWIIDANSDLTLVAQSPLNNSSISSPISCSQ